MLAVRALDGVKGHIRAQRLVYEPLRLKSENLPGFPYPICEPQRVSAYIRPDIQNDISGFNVFGEEFQFLSLVIPVMLY
jgi:hypothetical protein